MVNRKYLLVFLCLLPIVFLSFAQAEAVCSYVVGDWDFTAQMVTYDSSTQSHEYQALYGVLHITEQQDCLIFGYTEIGGDPSGPSVFTGVILNQRIKIQDGYTDIEGLLTNYDGAQGIYKGMIFGLTGRSSDESRAGKGSAVRR